MAATNSFLAVVFFYIAIRLRLKSRASQIGRSVANGSPTMRHFLEKSYVFLGSDAEMGRAKLCTLRRNTASIMKILCFILQHCYGEEEMSICSRFDITICGKNLAK